MHQPRAGIVVPVIGLALLVGGWWLTSIGSAGPLKGLAWGGWQVPTSASLTQQLQQFLASGAVPFQAGRARPVPLRRPAPTVHGSVCFVAAVGFCSIRPCVVPVAAAPRPGCSAGSAPVRAVPVSRP
ncbi:MAG TPA: hypothetical protein VGF81_00885 [Solirubrobacteraceae bacterium]